MPTMKEDTTLRVNPGAAGALTEDGDAFMNDQVDVLGTEDVDTPAGKESWTKVKLFVPLKTPEGWVRSSVVDLAGTVPGGPIDKLRFARQCWIEALFSDANPHYVATIAELRSGTANGANGKQIGPFRLLQSEWDDARAVASFDLASYAATDIADWRMQVVVFTLMTHAVEAELLGELGKITAGRRPTAVEMCLAQLIGTKAAIAAIKTLADPIKKDLAAVTDDKDLPLGKLSRDDLAKRCTEVFDAPQPSPDTLTGLDLTNRLRIKLQAALNATRTPIMDAGNEIAGDQEHDPGTLPGADDPVGGQTNGSSGDTGGGPTPHGGTVKVNGAGGALGELIAAGESAGDYNAFNRGLAGRSTGTKPDFSKMTISQIMALQARRRTDPERLFAIGKYQMIPDTFKLTVQNLKLDRSQLLTPKLQEKCFRDYLVGAKRKKLQGYIMGKHNNLAAAQLDLAQEFASVGVPPSGRSFFDKVGNNKASISPGKVEQILNAERAKFAQNKQAMNNDEKKAWEALSPGMA